jgi:hypothetical protein
LEKKEFFSAQLFKDLVNMLLYTKFVFPIIRIDNTLCSSNKGRVGEDNMGQFYWPGFEMACIIEPSRITTTFCTGGSETLHASVPKK